MRWTSWSYCAVGMSRYVAFPERSHALIFFSGSRSPSSFRQMASSLIFLEGKTTRTIWWEEDRSTSSGRGMAESGQKPDETSAAGQPMELE